MWLSILAVSAGAVIGANLRWALGLWLNRSYHAIPSGTPAANLSGGCDYVARYEDALRAYGISGSVYTVDELARELGVDSERARAACESLERRGAAALFGENGVKFA